VAAQSVVVDTSTVQYRANAGLADTVGGIVTWLADDIFVLGGWRVEITYRVPLIDGKPDSSLAGAAYVEPQYKQAAIEYDLDYLTTLPWALRYELVLHEFVHIPVWPLAEEADNDYLEELLVTELTQAFVRILRAKIQATP